MPSIEPLNLFSISWQGAKCMECGQKVVLGPKAFQQHLFSQVS
jgi:hypothetical protein